MLSLLVLHANQGLFLGTGGGSGYSRGSRTYIPASTLLGAMVGRFRAMNAGADDEDLERRLCALGVSDAVLVDADADGDPADWMLGAAVPLDRLLCKYPKADCPKDGYSCWDEANLSQPCATCGGNLTPSKGDRRAPMQTVTRVALSDLETAEEGQLFQRASLESGGRSLVALVDDESDALCYLGIAPSVLLRVGGSRSIAGEITVEKLTELKRVPWVAHSGWVRMEMLTPGVFVDEWGFPSPEPTPAMLEAALGLKPGDVEVADRRLRWSSTGGWGARSGIKPEDVCVLPHSVFVLKVAEGTLVPGYSSKLGMRTFEGCGWALLGPMPGRDRSDQLRNSNSRGSR